MTERWQRRKRHGHRGRTRGNLYASVMEESDAAVLEAAESAEGLTDELAVVRLLLRQQLAERSENLDLTIKGMHLLVRMVTAQAHLSGEDAAQFSEGVERAIDQFSRDILGKEIPDAEAAHG